MSRVLVLYGTTDGHTRLIADAIGDTLRQSGVDADVIRAGTEDPNPAADAASHGGATDTTRDYDYTDWQDLKRFTEEFRSHIRAAA